MKNHPDSTTHFVIQASKESPNQIVLRGIWRIGVLDLSTRRQQKEIQRTIDKLKGLQTSQTAWDISQIEALDSLGANMLWLAWHQKIPDQLLATPTQKEILQQIIDTPLLPNNKSEGDLLRFIKPQNYIDSISALLILLGSFLLTLIAHLQGIVSLLGQSVLDILTIVRHPSRLPWREISAHIYKTGAQALGITALVGFLIGIVLSYLSAQQLKQFGANSLIVNLLGISIIRELGPVLAAILVAGRSGSAMTAQIGVMRVTEEIDAMRVMGIPINLRLIFPKVSALILVMPLLATWVSAIALLGGALAAQLELNLPIRHFIDTLPKVVSLTHIWIGLGKSLAFGASIALIACHFGLKIQPNTDSLGAGTTRSVVFAITSVILLDALFAVLFKSMI